MGLMKWPPDISNLENSHGIEEFRIQFDKFCKTNNFKTEEIWYLYAMLNTFCYLNKVDKCQ